jgi:Tfp pilus assembly protein PilF
VIAPCYISMQNADIIRMAKPTLDLSQVFSRAISAYNAGKLVEAEQLCQQIINAKRDLFDALHLLAVVQSRLGKKDTALASYDRALKVRGRTLSRRSSTVASPCTS